MAELTTDQSTMLELLKYRLGIMTDSRDVYLSAIIKSIVEELNTMHKAKINTSMISHQLFVVDYAEYRYSNRDNPSMPRHIRWRLNNLMISALKRS